MFRAGEPKWDQSTMSGRLKHFLKQVDLRYLFYSHSKLEDCTKMIEEHQQGCTKYSNKELWNAQYAVFGRIHPDTKEAVPLPFSMTGFSPANIPICALMIMPGTSPLVASFYQVANQTMNAGFNYCNRNASKETTTTQMVGGYVGAVTLALTVAATLRKAITNNPRLSAPMKRTLATFLPFPAVVSASVCNIVLMRNGEFFNGVEVFNEDGTSAGVSHKAARNAIFTTALTRIVMPTPIFFLPPAGIAILERTTSIFKKFPKTRIPITVALSTLGLYLGIPLAVACFPQTSILAVDKLEPTCNPTGSFVYYNKGL
ncbi:sideroflexin-5-like isoform X2 [Bolinopsis microptera]|uniref:sideroflexin-5-like isoform X2 n=1 Tax=Bolinopsis microptera TaxID=2820187 RepID=UPI0030796514